MDSNERMKCFNKEWQFLIQSYFFEKNLRPATECSYIKALQSFIKFLGNKITPQRVDKKKVLEWRLYMLKDLGLAPISWNSRVSHLRALFNLGIKSKILMYEENPFNAVTVRAGEKKKKVLSQQQLEKIYLVMHQYEDLERKRKPVPGGTCALYPTWFWITVLDTLRFTGIRKNQLLNIRLSDVDIEKGLIELRLEGSKNHREWKVPIVNHLRERISVLKAKAHACGAKNSDFLFDVRRITSKKKNYTYNEEKAPETIVIFFRRLSRECGFAVTSHRFRHTLATELMRAPDRNLMLVKDLLGHRSVSTTMEYVVMDVDIVRMTLEQEIVAFAGATL